MSDIAREAGVSKNTVSLALRGDIQIPAATRERIIGIAQRLGYRKNPVVAHLMAQLASTRRRGFQFTLALINANQDKKAFTRHPTVPSYVEGCRRRATELGYELDEFWLHEPGLDGGRLNRILRARGIRGIVVVGLMRENRLPEAFLPTWKAFPTVVTGVKTRDPALPFACADHHSLVRSAVQQALKLGYSRPGLAIDEAIDSLVERRFTAGFESALAELGGGVRIPPFYHGQSVRNLRQAFREWREQWKVDVILCLYHSIQDLLEEEKVRVPRDMGLIQLEWRNDHPNWAGMDQHNDVSGAAAVDMLVGMVRNGESGIPRFPLATLVGSSWVEGRTVSRRRRVSVAGH